MNSLTIKIPTFYGYRGLHYRAPEDFNELSKKQLLSLMPVIFSDTNIVEKKTKATIVLFGLKQWHLGIISAVQMSWLNTFSAWLFDGEHTLTDNKIRTISVNWFHTPYYGPVGGFETLTSAEWIAADAAYMAFIEGQDMKHLDNLIAILWRPKQRGVNPNSEQFTNDYRVPYNPYTVESRAAQIAPISKATKYAILFWYLGCRREWEQVFDKVFSGDGAQHVEHYGWPETIQKISGDKFGTLQETENTYMYKILFKMQIDMKDYEEFKRKNLKHYA